jgi:hypothetical protein
MTDTIPPPVHMPDDNPTPRRRNGGEVPPPKAWMPDGFGAPRSLQSLAKTRFGGDVKPHGRRGMK